MKVKKCCHDRFTVPAAVNSIVASKAPNLAETNQLFALFNAERYTEVASRARLLIQRDSDSGFAWKVLGAALQSQGKHEESLPALQKGAKLLPDDAESHMNLGSALQALLRHDEAATSFRRALELKPDNAEAHINLGVALRMSGRPEDALASFRRSLDIKPNYAEAHSNVSDVLLILGQVKDAVRSGLRALEIKPNSADAHLNLGAALRTLGEIEGAVMCFRGALKIKPDYVAAHSNLGSALQDLERLTEAEASYRQALLLDPNNRLLKSQLSALLLCMGRLTEGWAEHDHRFATQVSRRDFAHPHWAGEDLAGKSILIWREQGVGDEIMFTSMYAEMIERSGRCVFECARKIMPLLARTFPRAQFVVQTDPPHPATQEGIDCQCAAGSLGRWLRPTLESFPQQRGYLTPNPERVKYWQERLAALGVGLKIGFCWRSSLTAGSRALQYTTLDQWGPIFTLLGVHFVNLQYDKCDAELEAARQQFGVPLHVFSEVDLLDDLDEVAALTQALDLVISAGTATCVMAAALGVPTWQLSTGVDWTMHGTGHNPWFPTQRSFNRRWNQPWSEIIAAVAEQLESVTSPLPMLESARRSGSQIDGRVWRPC